MENEIKTIHHSPGTVIMVENSINEGYFYILKSGSVDVQYDIPFNDKILNKLNTGDTFGLVSGLTNNPVHYTLIAEADCEVIRIPIELLGDYLQNNKEICLKIVSLYSNQLRALNNYLITKHPSHQEIEKPHLLLNTAEGYKKLNQYDIAAHCLLKYIQWAKRNQPQLNSIAHAEKLLAEIAPDFKMPEYKSNTLLLQKGVVVFVENEPADYFYFIQKGAIKISKLVNNQEFILSILREGEIFGEMAVLNKKVRNASAIVFENVKIMRLPVETFMDEVGDKILTKMFETFARRIWYAHQRVTLLEMSNPNAMLYGYIQILISDINAKNKHHARTQNEYIFNFSLMDLKRMIGMEEARDDSIHEFLSDENIDISNHSIRIYDKRKIDDKVAIYKSRERKKKIIDIHI
ncbi:MAG: cyclic nucleotide-binding domain-containing protein [Spirochaetota bacterium]|nr:cyclic nucleotide-binding domain-containing protein [Spirochaetota bacterium]